MSFFETRLTRLFGIEYPIIQGGMAAVLAMGGEAVYMGTRFCPSEECIIHPKVKQLIVDTAYNETDYILMSVGDPVRAIRNKQTQEILEIEQAEGAPGVRKFMSAHRGEGQGLGGRTAMNTGDIEESVLPLGMVSGRISEIKPVKEIEAAVGRVPVLVCEMVKGSREVSAGMTRLQGFPPVILFGLGGIFAEVLQDSAVRLAPFDWLEALRQIDSIQAADFLGPIRGMVPVDKEALADLLVGLGLLSVQFPEIREIDLNPIVIAEGKPIVVDALFVR